MMASLIEFLKGRFNGFSEKVVEIFTRNLARFLLAWGTLVTVVGWVWWVYTKLKSGLAGLAELLDDVVPVSLLPAGGFQTYFDLINTFFPLTELIHYMFVYVQIVTALLVIRIARRMIGSLFGAGHA